MSDPVAAAVDPVLIALISGGMAISGVFVSGTINYFLSKQKEEQDVRVFQRQQVKFMEEKRLQAVEKLYRLTLDISSLAGIFRNLLVSSSLETAATAAYVNEWRSVFTEFYCTTYLHFPELGPQAEKLTGNQAILAKALYVKFDHESEFEEEERHYIALEQWDRSAREIVSVLQSIQGSLMEIIKNEGLVILRASESVTPARTQPEDASAI